MPRLSPKRKIVAATLAVATLQALMLLSFAWPAANSGPRDVPIAVAGPTEAVGQIAEQLSGVRVVDDDTAAFDVTTVADRSAAQQMIDDQDIYGAVVATPDGPELLIATGASPAMARLLQNAAAGQAAGDGAAVTDIAPPNPDDPNGMGLATGVLPLVMTSAAGGALALLALRRTAHRAALVLGLSTVGGLASAAILTYGVGVLDGPYLAYAGITALIIGAVAGSVTGLGALFGRAGTALGALTMILLGNPLSAAPSAPELLPQPWGEIGQLLPPGAGVSAIRSAEFFDAAAIGTPLLVLSVWMIAGLALLFTGNIKRRTTDASDESTSASDGELQHA